MFVVFAEDRKAARRDMVEVIERMLQSPTRRDR
jgi:hypothetical protein